MMYDSEKDVFMNSGSVKGADLTSFDDKSMDETKPLMTASTESQREIWTSAKFGLQASLAFNESVYLRFKGAFDLPIMQQAISKLVARHEALRSTFSIDGTLFCVANTLDIDMPCVDLSMQEDRDEQLHALLVSEVEKPFDLERGPLFRATLVKMDSQDHVLVLTAHHIICDGWSYAVLLKDLAVFYMALIKKQDPQLDAANQFTTYAHLMQERSNSSDYATDETYWLESFKTIPNNVDLPTDRPRPPFKTYTSLREDYTLDAQLVTSIKKVGAKLGCSFVQILLASFKVLLHRLSNQEDFVVGILAAGQASSGQSNLVGHCVNTLPIRSLIKEEMRFVDFLKSTKKTMLDAYEHQQYTYGSLINTLKILRDPSRLPLCSILFNIDQTLDANTLGFEGLNTQFRSNPRRYENFEVFVNAVEQEGTMVLEVQFNSDLFDATTIRRYMSCFETMLRGITSDPNQEIARLPLLSHDVLEKIIVQWNATQATYPNDMTLHALFSQQAQKTPNSIAVEFEWENGLSYQNLDERSNQLAHFLRSQGVVEGTLVGLYLDRSIDMIIALLAVLKAGGAYVPLDPAYPNDRIEFMINDSKLPIIISQSWLVASQPKHQAHEVILDVDSTKIATLSVAPLASQSNPESPAYVIYTSGSTGKPKGVIVPHRGVVNFLTSMGRAPGITSNDILVAVTTLSFDIAALELFLPIVSGAKTIIASRETALDGKKLLHLLKKSGATMMQATPSTWRLLIASGWNDSTLLGASFKVLCGGEALPQDLVNKLLERVDNFWNMYGPTETTIWSTCNRITHDKSTITIGRPIDNTQLYILDNLLQPVPVGVPGELYIGGAGVTLGYLNRPDLSGERFLDNPYFDPFAETLSPRIYKTGDMARYLADGTVEYLGRNDNQVKVRGYRIEMGEIEAILSQYPGVLQCVVMVREFAPGDMRIVAYVISNTQESPPIEAVREYLRTFLPDYMMPQHLVALQQFPQTQNGKIDRNAFPAPEAIKQPSKKDAVQLPKSEMELRIARIWGELLHTDKIGLNDNFFNLGGHSLISMQFIARLQEETGFRLNPRFVLLNTLAQIASQVQQSLSEQQQSTEAMPKGKMSAIRKQVNRLLTVIQGNIPAKTDENLSAKTQGIIKHNPDVDHIPVSIKQERLWQLEQLNPGQTAYNLPAAFCLKGVLNLTALQMSLNELIRRHDILRTLFVQNPDGLVEQKILPTFEFDLKPYDLKKVPLDKLDAKLLELLTIEAVKPFDLTKGPLIRASLYELNHQENVLFFMAHHAIWDGWSFDIFLSEMASLYEAFSHDKPSVLPDLDLQYRDFAIWQRQHIKSGQLIKEQQYWLKQLAGPLPVLTLKGQQCEADKASFAGSMHKVAFPQDLVESLTAVGRKEGVTLSVLLLTAFKALLYVYSGQKDNLVGVPVLGRNDPSVQSVIGYFVNTLPIRTCVLDEDMTFRQLLNQVNENTYEAYNYQEMPLETLMSALEQSGTNKPNSMIQAMFSFQDATQRKTQWGDLVLEQMHLHPGGVAYDVILWFKHTNKGLNGAIEYRTDLFNKSLIVNMANDLSTLLHLINENPNIGLNVLHEHFKPSIKPTTQSTMPLKSTATKIPNKPMTPFYFDNKGKQLFGLFYPANSQMVSDTAILLCYPIGQEYIRSHWAFGQLATLLASQGLPVLRFEYYATGDSSGESSEGSVAQWKEDVVLACNQLLSLSGARKVSIVGLRFGATIASLAVNEGLAVQDLILWDPVINGQTYLEEIKTLHHTMFPSQLGSSNLEEIMGFPFPMRLQKEMAAIDLSALTDCNAGKIHVICSQDSEQGLDFFKAQTNYHHIPDAGDWNILAKANVRLISPRIIQAIVGVLTKEA